jgi:hypothetical protein
MRRHAAANGYARQALSFDSDDWAITDHRSRGKSARWEKQ